MQKRVWQKGDFMREEKKQKRRKSRKIHAEEERAVHAHFEVSPEMRHITTCSRPDYNLKVRKMKSLQSRTATLR